MANSSPILCALGLLVIIIFPVYISVVVYQAPDFNPVPLPAEHSFGPSISIPSHHDRVLEVTDRIGDGFLLGPEDLAFDEKTGYLYTGCQDGWIRRVRVVGEAEEVEDWAYVGGRPLGLAFGPDGSLVVADVDKVNFGGLISLTVIQPVQNEAAEIGYCLAWIKLVWRPIQSNLSAR